MYFFLVVMCEFFNGDRGLKFGITHPILEQLKKLNSWFERQTYYEFYGSSILIAYDAARLAEGAIPSTEPISIIRMIDFTQTVLSPNGTKDDNYLYGLEKLVALIQELDSENFKCSGIKVFLGKEI